MSSQRTKQRKIGSRSCDACKIRKVRCTELPPCERCVAIGIECTFNKTQSTRGPRTLRAKTLQQIQEAQQTGAYDNGRAYVTTATPTAQMPLPNGTATSTTPGANSGGTPETATTNSEPDASLPHHGIYGPPPGQGQAPPSHGITVESLVLRLCIYRLRLFPVWPIIAVEEIIASLQRDAHDLDTYALALSVGAATMAQLKLDRFRDAGINDVVTASVLERECQRVRDRLPAAAGLNALRTSFFLHIYHENQLPGGTRSLLYLREAITLAQVMGLHRPATYLSLDASEGRVRRRILWLLFVTERGVAMLHRLPVVLRSAERLPPLDGDGPDEEAHILPAFKRLVNLFWTFDRSGAFDIIQDAADDSGSGGGVASPELLAALQRRLQEEDPLDGDDGGSDVQRADIAATRQWMKVLVWRATLGGWRANSTSPSTTTHAFSPIQIAHEFLELISRLPSAALEAHGPALEYKVYEIASAVADAIPGQLATTGGLHSMDVRPADILMRLQRILATSRGGNNSLLGLLAARIAQVEAPQFSIVGDYPFATGPSRRIVEEVVDDDWQQDGQRTPSSPWQSLVAAAELEQQSLGGQQQPMATRLQGQPLPRTGTITPNGLNGAGWYAQPLGLLNQLYGLDPPMSQSPPPLDALPAGELTEMLANDNWLLGLNMGTPSPRMT